MAKVFGLHMIRLKEGIDEAEFEKFIAKEFPKLGGGVEGIAWYFLKGIKGDRKGQFAMLYEAESVEAHERAKNHEYSEAQQAVYANFMEAWAAFSGSDVGESTIFTDYLELAQTGQY